MSETHGGAAPDRGGERDVPAAERPPLRRWPGHILLIWSVLTALFTVLALGDVIPVASKLSAWKAVSALVVGAATPTIWLLVTEYRWGHREHRNGSSR
jgi:hypothetical protein